MTGHEEVALLQEKFVEWWETWFDEEFPLFDCDKVWKYLDKYEILCKLMRRLEEELNVVGVHINGAKIEIECGFPSCNKRDVEKICSNLRRLVVRGEDIFSVMEKNLSFCVSGYIEPELWITGLEKDLVKRERFKNDLKWDYKKQGVAVIKRRVKELYADYLLVIMEGGEESLTHEMFFDWHVKDSVSGLVEELRENLSEVE